MTVIKQNSKVTISYQGKLDNGELFESISEKRPLEVKIGNSELPPSLEDKLIGMSAGEQIKVRVPPEEGYGARQEMLLHTISKKSLGEKITPKPGMILSMNVEKDGQSHQVPATVLEVGHESVVIDYNHPLAGHHLTYLVSILKVE